MGDFWIEVETPTEMVGRDGTTPIGSLNPGQRYRAVARDEFWVAIPGPNDTVGFAPLSATRVISTEPPPPASDRGAVGAGESAVPPPTAPLGTPSPPTVSPPTAPPPTAPPPTAPPPTAFSLTALSPSASRPQPNTSTLAVASFVLGILWLFGIGSAAAVALGHVSLNRIDRSKPRQAGRGFAIAGLVLGYGGLAVLIVFAAIVTLRGGDETANVAQPPGPTTASVPDPQESVPRAPGPLLPGRELVLEGITKGRTVFIETADAAVLFEGSGDVTMTFNTSGGPVTGDFSETITGQDDEGNTHTVTYTGVLAGTYDPGTGQFEGTVEISGTAPPGYEAAIPTVTLWDGGVVVSSGGCADSHVECAFGATQPVVDVYWEMPLPVDAIDPTYLGGTG